MLWCFIFNHYFQRFLFRIIDFHWFRYKLIELSWILIKYWIFKVFIEFMKIINWLLICIENHRKIIELHKKKTLIFYRIVLRIIKPSLPLIEIHWFFQYFVLMIIELLFILIRKYWICIDLDRKSLISIDLDISSLNTHCLQ